MGDATVIRALKEKNFAKKKGEKPAFEEVADILDSFEKKNTPKTLKKPAKRGQTEDKGVVAHEHPKEAENEPILEESNLTPDKVDGRKGNKGRKPNEGGPFKRTTIYISDHEKEEGMRIFGGTSAAYRWAIKNYKGGN